MNSFHLEFSYLLEWPTDLKETLMFTNLLKDIIKDTDEKSDGEINRASPERVLSVGTSVPVKLKYIILLVHGCIHPPGSSLSPGELRFLYRLPHIGMISY